MGAEPARKPIQHPLAHPSEPPVQRGEDRGARAQSTDGLPQPRPVLVRGDVEANALLDDGEREGLAREQLRGQDPSRTLACGASGERDAQAPILALSTRREQNGASLGPASGKCQCPAGAAVAAPQRAWKWRTLGCGREEVRIVAGERNRDSLGPRMGINFRRLRVYETRSLIPLSSLATADQV